jgi:cell division protein DivIC
MKYLSGNLSFIKNKYVIAITFFLVWMTFFDERDWGMIMERKHKLRELEKSEKHLGVQIAETRKELELLKTNAQTIEKYAREKYYMKKDNEDLFIVNPAEKK